jgi:hypothetical protein
MGEITHALTTIFLSVWKGKNMDYGGNFMNFKDKLNVKEFIKV